MRSVGAQSPIICLRRLARSSRALFRFGMCLWLLAAVSVHDAILVVWNDNVIKDMEENPVGKWLINVQGGDVWIFVWTKLAGTAIVCATLIKLQSWHRRIALHTVVVLAALQTLLLGYLTFT